MRKNIFWIEVMLVVLSACQPFQTPVLVADPSVSQSPTPTPRISPTVTQTATQIPEPGWYQPLAVASDDLDYNYALVSNPQVKIYHSLQDAVRNTIQYSYLPIVPGYVAYVGKDVHEGEIFYELPYGKWLRGEDIQEVDPSSFTGIILKDDVPFRFGWVLESTQSQTLVGTPVQTYERYSVVSEYSVGGQREGYLAVGPDEWLPVEVLALVSPEIPAAVFPNVCRFIHVDLLNQTLSVYFNCRMVFATLISSGIDEMSTFPGSFFVIYKMDYRTLDSEPEAEEKYYLESVPYFMTYYGNLGLHGVYWHDRFGTPVSHGSINLSVTDAQWLYQWVALGDTLYISAGE